MRRTGADEVIPRFERVEFDTGEVTIAAAVGGSGPPVLLLHGYPQTRAMWHAVAPVLAERFTVVAADLRGYGDSSKPAGDERHERYAKRTMAADQLALMRGLGHERFAVAGHDRGGRVGHRMALDHPDAVSRLAVLDIVPTRIVFASTDTPLATAYFHWFFLIQPGGLPERLIGGDPGYWLDELLRRWAMPGHEYHPAARAEYTRCFCTPEAVHASCEDYRAAASIDLEHDAADRGPLELPLLVLWGLRGRMERVYDVPATWRSLATDVTTRPVDCGHFVAEERPRETAEALLEFLAPEAGPG
jgi:haloacetate dehalogenase